MNRKEGYTWEGILTFFSNRSYAAWKGYQNKIIIILLLFIVLNRLGDEVYFIVLMFCSLVQCLTAQQHRLRWS